MSDQKIILPSAPEAATYRTDIKGWVSRDGHFYGGHAGSEQTARWAGATHVLCTQCGATTNKNYTICDSCRDKRDLEKWKAMERRPYDGGWLYSHSADRWFRGEGEASEYLEDEKMIGCILDDLRLVMSKPVYPHEIDPDEHYSDELPEDGEVDAGLRDAFDALNTYIRENRVPLSYEPVDVVPVFAEG